MNRQQIQQHLDSGKMFLQVGNRVLKLGQNTQHRVCRPAWTSEDSSGRFDSHKARHGKSLETNFFVETEGQYKKNVPLCSRGRKRGQNGRK